MYIYPVAWLYNKQQITDVSLEIFAYHARYDNWIMANMTVALVLSFILLQILWQQCSGQICMFHHLEADCYYRIDHISLSYIHAKINQCEDPVSVDITITNKNPKVDWKSTFSKSVERKTVSGFLSTVFITVALAFEKDSSKSFLVDVDFIVEGIPDRVDFIDEKIDLITDGCIVLSKASRIAVGVLVTVFILASVAVVVVIIMRRRLRKRHLAASELVTNAQEPSETTPPADNFTDNQNATDLGQDNRGSHLSNDVSHVVVYSNFSDSVHSNFSDRQPVPDC